MASLARRKLLVLLLLDVVLWLGSSAWNVSICPGGSSDPSCLSAEPYVASTLLGEGSFIALPIVFAVFIFVAVKEVSAESKKYGEFVPPKPDPGDELVLTDVGCGFWGGWHRRVWAKADLHFTKRRVYLSATEQTKPQLWSVGYAKATYQIRQVVSGFSVEYAQMKDARLQKTSAWRDSLQRRFGFRYGTGTGLIHVQPAHFYVNREQFEKLRTSLPAIVPPSVKLVVPDSPES